MALYDINGKEISSSASATESQVKSAIVRAVAAGEIELPTVTTGGTLALNLDETLLSGIQAGYERMMADYQLDDVDGIPLFIGSDNHGNAYSIYRIPHNTDKDVMCLAMGDFFTDYFNLGQLGNYREITKPISNIISVPGNHDVLVREASEIDGKHNVKYLALSNYSLNADGYGMNVSFTSAIHTAQMEWLIRELSKDDGLDIIILTHEPMTNTLTLLDGTTENWQAVGNTYAEVMKVLTARKNKTGGTATDSDGVEHSFDFSGCVSDLLCSFHGHIHGTRYNTEGITQYVQCRTYAQSIDAYSVSWALIDRHAMTLTVYIDGQDDLVIPL